MKKEEKEFCKENFVWSRGGKIMREAQMEEEEEEGEQVEGKIEK